MLPFQAFSFLYCTALAMAYTTQDPDETGSASFNTEERC